MEDANVECGFSGDLVSHNVYFKFDRQLNQAISLLSCSGAPFSSTAASSVSPSLPLKRIETVKHTHTAHHAVSDDGSSHSNRKRKLGFVKGATVRDSKHRASIGMEMWVNRLNEVRENWAKH